MQKFFDAKMAFVGRDGETQDTWLSFGAKDEETARIVAAAFAAAYGGVDLDQVTSVAVGPVSGEAFVANKTAEEVLDAATTPYLEQIVATIQESAKKAIATRRGALLAAGDNEAFGQVMAEISTEALGAVAEAHANLYTLDVWPSWDGAYERIGAVKADVAEPEPLDPFLIVCTAVPYRETEDGYEGPDVVVAEIASHFRTLGLVTPALVEYEKDPSLFITGEPAAA